MSTSKKFFNSSYSFILALILGMILAVGASVWATSVGTNVSVTGTLTVSSATASSTVTRALGVGTSTPSVMLAVGGAAANTTGHGYFTGGLGVGAITTTSGQIIANVSLGVATTSPAEELSVVGDVYLTSGLGVGRSTTTAGAIENSGNVLFGDAAGDLAMFNSASLIFNNQGTTTIPASNAASWAYATSSAPVPFLRFNTSNYRIGIGTSSPATTLSVGGDGHIYALGGLGIGVATTTAGVITNTGNALFGDAAGDLAMFNTARLIYNNQGTTTIPASDLAAWAYATSTAAGVSADIPFLRFDTNAYRIGIGTTTPGATLSVGGAGNIYALGGLGIGVATTTAGVIENIGNVLFGDAAGDLVMSNAAVWIRNNAGTTTIPSSNANSFAYATTTSGAFLRFDTSGTRVGISSSTPGATLAVGGDGTAIVMGGATSSLSIQSTNQAGAQRGGCIELESAEGAGTVFRLYATSAGVPAVWESGPCR